MKQLYIKDLAEGKKIQLYCWIANKRTYKNMQFLTLYDSTGVIQGIANCDECKKFDKLSKVTIESAIRVDGKVIKHNGRLQINILDYKVEALATLKLSPSPNANDFDVFAHANGLQVITHPTFYIRNRKLSTVYFLKSCFKREMQDYFWKKDFVEFEAPTLTKQTLYKDSGAIWLDVQHQRVSLSRCATFHLEPAIIPYERIFTITNSHADERVRTNRHLIEYLHLKAEMCWINLEELIDFAGQMYYEIAKNTYEHNKEKFHEIVPEKKILQKLEKLNPKNHVLITYDEAVKIIKKSGIEFEYGKSLTTKQEKIITKHFGEKFVWVKYIPYTVEGFMFKRNKDNPFLTQTCDLIAPCGFGEILGCAEKMTDYDDVIKSMKEKDKYEDYDRYKDYALLHQYGLPFHGGIGMGIERALRYLLDLDHVKYTKPFAVIKGSQINH